MKTLYEIAGISKQAIWSQAKRDQQRDRRSDEVISTIKTIRKEHKRMGCGRMYYACTDSPPVGRDIFERIGLENGFRLKRQRNVTKITWSQRVEVYPNRIQGKIINGINQVWQSDISYIRIEDSIHYHVCIEDVYSRRILVLHISKSLSAEQLLKALKIALLVRRGMIVAGCIFHSDRGSQYIDRWVKKLIKDHQMLGSMCLLPQENAYVERIHGTIKYEYLYELELTNANNYRQIKKVVALYNDKRPHSSLGMMTPTAFEQAVEKMDENLRPKMQIYQWNHGLLTKPLVFNKRKKKQKRKSQHNKDNR
jgi:putative transposase